MQSEGQIQDWRLIEAEVESKVESEVESKVESEVESEFDWWRFFVLYS